MQRKRQNNDDNRHTNQRGPSAQAVHGAVRERYGAASRRVAWLTLFSFLVSPATAVFAGSDINNAIDTAIGNANTHDGVFTENTQFNTTFEQNTGNAVIKWDVMDQEADNTLTFVQGAGDRVLNQASGIRASVFRGMIRCDATCIFANEAGVTFADGSYLDVGQLVTIAGAVSEASFRDGGLHATGITGDVNNYGIINARDVMLVGARIANGGEINIEDGTLTAIIGSEVWLREHGSNVVVHAELPELRNDEGFDAAPGIDNSGTINAGSGNVRLLAGDLLSFGIRNTGRIEASDISLDAGGLIELSGPSALDASNYSTGAVGGTIKVLGGYIAILDTATLDASGHSGGGEILVGGEQAGASGTRTSQGTYVGNNTTLRADASHTGDGGRIIVWSDKTTRSYGTIAARGGTLSGNGGFVETSGREYLDVQSSPLIHARSGNATDHGGEWLLDPFNIEIVAACAGDCLGDELDEEESYDPNLIFNATVHGDADTSEIAVDLITDVLIAGSNVTITTEGAGSDEGDQVGNITLSADLIINDGALDDTTATLTLLAANDINIDGAIANNDTELTLNLDFQANATQPELDAVDGELDGEYRGDVTTNNTIASGGGSVELSGVNITLNNLITTDGGSVLVLSEGGDAMLNSTIDTTRSDPSEVGGNVTVASSARVTVSPTPVEDLAVDDDEVYEDLVLGGNIYANTGSEIHTGGAAINLSAGNRIFSRKSDAFGGNLYVDGLLNSGGGGVVLDAVRAVNTSDQGTVSYGGLIEISEDAVVTTEGGNVNVRGQIDIFAGGRDDGKTTVRINGEIDTQVYDPISLLVDADEEGGSINIASNGNFGRLEIDDRRASADPMMVTNGGDVSIISFGSTTVNNASIDARFTGVDPPDTALADQIQGEIVFSSVGRTTIAPDTGEAVTLRADSKVELAAGFDGLQSLRINTEGGGNVTLSAEEIVLSAGDGFGSFASAQVDLGRATDRLQFTNGSEDGNPLDFTLRQDSSIDSSNLPTAEQFFSDAIDVENFTLQSLDGDISLENIEIAANDTLTLSALSGITIDDDLMTPTPTSFDVGSTLEIEVFESFTVDGDLATKINDATADALRITAGELAGAGNPLEANLTIASDLQASESITLHGGAGGNGNLLFASTPKLTSDSITLWAGDGSASAVTPRVVAIDPDDATELVTFELTGANPAFTLRQSAPIENENIPTANQFVDAGDMPIGVDSVNYTLRSDGGDIGGEESIDATKIEGTFLTALARTGIDPDFAGGTEDGSAHVRGLDIGGLEDFTYTRTLNDKFVIDDGANETVLVIRAGVSGAGDLEFDGTPGDDDTDEDFIIEADEIRLIAGDGLAGAINSRIILNTNLGPNPTLVGHTNAEVETFVYRQDNQITEADLPGIEDFFDDVAPNIYVVHSDYDFFKDTFEPGSAIQIDQFESLPYATQTMILSGELVVISRDDGQDLDLVADLTRSGTLDIRADNFDLIANDVTDFDSATPVAINLDETRLVIRDFVREQDEDEAALPVASLFDVDSTPATAPNVVRIQQEADITTAQLTSFRASLAGDVTDHDELADLPDNEAMFLFIESLEGDIALAPAEVAGTQLNLTVHGEGSAIHWNRDAGAAYNVEDLVVNADHSLILGETAIGSPGAFSVTSMTGIEINTGTAGSDGDLGFAEETTLTANQIILRAGRAGSLAQDNETPSVDVTSNAPTFAFTNLAEDDEPVDTLFEIRQDAGFVDDISRARDGESLIASAAQLTSGDEIGTLRLVSDAGDIDIANLTATFLPYVEDSSGTVAHLDLQAGVADPLERGVISIQDLAAEDTNLTLYEGIDITADEVILAANGTGAVIADHEDVLFRSGSNNLTSSPFRFTIRHEQGDICEGAAGCADGALPDLNQFISPIASRNVNYTLESQIGMVEITTQIAAKLSTGSSVAPRFVDLTVLARDIDGDADVRITANLNGRDADVQLGSLVIGEVNRTRRIEFESSPNETVHLTTSGDQLYYGEVNINGAAAITGDTLRFTEDITGETAADLTINVREHLQIDRDITLPRGAFAEASRLRVNLDPGASELARIEFANDGETQTVSANRVEFFATRGADLGERGEFLPSGSRNSRTATIGKRNGDLELDVDTFRVSEGEKISVGGDLTIGDDNSSLITVGDISAVNIDLAATDIEILLRKAGEYLGFNGKVKSDGGVDLVANTIDVDGDIHLIGKGRAPVFGVHDPVAADSDLNRFPVAEISPSNRKLTPADFDWDVAAAPPDLHPAGAVRDDFSNIYFGPEIVPAPNAWLAAAALAEDNQTLASLDISLRDDAPVSLLSRARRAGIIDDVGSDLPDRATEKITISAARVLARDADVVAKRYQRLFGEDGEHTAQVKATLQSALRDYQSISGARRVLGFEFRRYLRNRPSSQLDAYLALEDLDALFSYHRNLGLTPGEYNSIQLRWLEAIKPNGISLDELAEAIHPSRFVRGSDILDIFGD